MPRFVDDILGDPTLSKFAPTRRWSAAQREENLLLLHYRVAHAQLRRLVPPELELQRYDGSAWIAVLAVQMRDVYAFRVPLPGSLGSFSEIDVGALVSCEGRLGLYFLSIEGGSRLTSLMARMATGFPYSYSDAQVRAADNGQFHATSGPRWVRGQAAASFDAVYGPSPTAAVPAADSLIATLAGQYSAFTVRRGKVAEFDEVHAKWGLVEAELDLRVNTLPNALDLDVAAKPDLQHYSGGRSIVSWLPSRVTADRHGLAPVEPPGT